MAELRFEVKVVATGEVRDQDGNLISPQTYEGVQHLTAEEIQEQLGITVPSQPQE